MGVAFSDNPMSALVASVDPSVATISVQDLDPEQAGRRVVVVGQVESANQRWTREGKPFVSAMLALLGGALEVVAWPDVYEQSRDLWEEGNLLQIVGQIRVREDRMSLVCKEAATYHVPSPDAPSTNGAAAREESGAPAATNGAPRAANGAPRATNGAPPPPTPSPSRSSPRPRRSGWCFGRRPTRWPMKDGCGRHCRPCWSIRAPTAFCWSSTAGTQECARWRPP